MPSTRGVYYGDEIYQSPYNIQLHGYRLYFSSRFKLQSFIRKFEGRIKDLTTKYNKEPYLNNYSIDKVSLLLNTYMKVEPITQPIKEG